MLRQSVPLYFAKQISVFSCIVYKSSFAFIIWVPSALLTALRHKGAAKRQSNKISQYQSLSKGESTCTTALFTSPPPIPCLVRASDRVFYGAVGFSSLPFSLLFRNTSRNESNEIIKSRYSKRSSDNELQRCKVPLYVPEVKL